MERVRSGGRGGLNHPRQPKDHGILAEEHNHGRGFGGMVAAGVRSKLSGQEHASHKYLLGSHGDHGWFDGIVAQ